MKKTIGIFGGSFNPIHTGHIALARQLRQAGGLDEVWLMVSPQNPLKQGSSDLFDDRLRYAMARLALHGEEGIVASDYELHLEHTTALERRLPVIYLRATYWRGQLAAFPTVVQGERHSARVPGDGVPKRRGTEAILTRNARRSHPCRGRAASCQQHGNTPAGESRRKH